MKSQSPLSVKRAGTAVRSRGLRVGYVQLTDAAPLIVARELGFFEKHKVRVELTRELGWGSIRDKIVYGELDAVHAPGGMLFPLLAGTQAAPVDVRALMLMNFQGNAITLSRRLWEKGAHEAKSLKKIIRVESPRRPVFAVVAWFSSHHFLLRSWLKVAGIDPDKQARITVLPPPLLLEHMKAGLIDGFCTGEPWNSAALPGGEGWIVATSQDIAPRHPEKILLAPTACINRQPEEFAALQDAVVEACAWCARLENRPALATLLHHRLFPDLPESVVRNTLTGSCDLGAGVRTDAAGFHIFATGPDTRPTPDQAQWLLRSLEESRLIRLTPSGRMDAMAAWLNRDACPGPVPAREFS